MRLALALAAVAIARQDYLCAEDVCFYHVPKTGGDSFKNLLRDKLKRRGRTFWSNEWCPRRSNGTAAMLFREPRAHVVSQYFECRDSEWARGRRIPSEEIRRRQARIRKHGHRLQYAVDDQGKEPDAVETLFVGALGLAHDLAHLYQV